MMQLSLILVTMAQQIPGAGINPEKVVAGFTEAISSANWGVAIGFGIMLLVWLARIIFPKIKTELLPYLAVSMGAAAGLSGSLVAGEPWLQAVMAGIGAGLSAAGTWGLLGVARKK